MRVLVATDLSKSAEIALREGAALSREPKGQLAIVHVRRRPTMLGIGSRVEPSADAVRQYAARVLGPSATSGMAVFVETGFASAKILRCADRFRADIVVVSGERSSGDAPRFGRVAERVVRHATCGVLVARSSSSRGVVLAATDLLQATSVVIRAAANEARRRRARLKVVHAIGFLEVEARYILQLSTPSISSDTRVRDAAWRELADAVAAVGAEARCELLEGSPAAAIVRDALATGAELVVVGHGRKPLERLFRASVSNPVVRHAPCSVLVVK